MESIFMLGVKEFQLTSLCQVILELKALIMINEIFLGTRVLLDFISDIEARCPGQIKVVDIGGGLSTSYTQREEPEGFTYQKYRDLLDKEADTIINNCIYQFLNIVFFSGS